MEALPLRGVVDPLLFYNPSLQLIHLGTFEEARTLAPLRRLRGKQARMRPVNEFRRSRPEQWWLVAG